MKTLTLWCVQDKVGFPCKDFEDAMLQAIEHNECYENNSDFLILSDDDKLHYSIEIDTCGGVYFTCHSRIENEPPKFTEPRSKKSKK